MTTADFLALGDSYTVGEGVAPDDAWPRQLVRALAGDAMPLAAPEIVAVTGWTTDELASAMASRALAPRYALVSLGIGVNDQYRGRDIARYRTGFVALLRRAVALAGGEAGRVIVVSIPDWGITPFARAQNRDGTAIAAAIDAFNALAQAEAVSAGARFVDITGISRACADAPAMLAADGLHPSAAQYARWLPAIAAAARVALAN